ncbi:MAG: ATP-binding protein [Prevotella sp.]|nr:ATP-binding protein [Prevotella sp.]
MEIRRNIVDRLKAWKESDNRKPLLLKGARQIGKTWVMETFGRECFDYCAKFDFDRQEELKSVFRQSKSPERIVKELALYCDVPIIAGKTLIVFDEIQECEEALNSLKYFCEDAPQYHIIAAGSLLGVAVKRRKMTVPVGKVRIERMYPISFSEFLKASNSQLWDYAEELTEAANLPEIILNKLKTEYRRYLVSGGMPEAVKCMLENKGMAEVDKTLQDILDLYELDFAKYADARDIPRIHAVWHSLPSQLAKENRKFIFKVVKPGARAKDYEDALMWLEDAGMIYRIYNISKPALPLSAYADVSAFKIYACDCGLLRRLANLPATVVMDNAANYTEFKGSMAENAVLQSLMPAQENALPFYWSPDSRAEIEFVIQHEAKIIPVEVKAENCISGRSLSVYNEKYHPERRIRFSSLNLQKNEGLLSCPAPLAEWYGKFL